MASDAPLEFLHDVRRKAVGVKREWLFEMNAHHFPMAGSGVLAGRGQRAAAIRAGGGRGGRGEGGGRKGGVFLGDEPPPFPRGGWWCPGGERRACSAHPRRWAPRRPG